MTLLPLLQGLVESSVLDSHVTSDSSKVGTPSHEDVAASQLPNNRAIQVIERIQKKLTGQDFGDEVLDHKTQVNRLIEEATSETNLAMLFHGEASCCAVCLRAF
jgi:phosphatidylinositol kinase/protein kinase (PI-3  family)